MANCKEGMANVKIANINTCTVVGLTFSSLMWVGSSARTKKLFRYGSNMFYEKQSLTTIKIILLIDVIFTGRSADSVAMLLRTTDCTSLLEEKHMTYT